MAGAEAALPARRPSAEPRRSAVEVFLVALGLGLTSFGGPIAHLGYFERAYVQRRRWISPEDYAGLVALCQTIPGPASSQVGFLVGLRQAGLAGGLAAWLGFTLPSALALFAFALLEVQLTTPLALAALHGLKLVAVAVVAQAVLSMGRKLCTDGRRTGLALLAAAVLLLVGGPATQMAALLAGAVGGMILCRTSGDPLPAPELPIGPRAGAAALVAFLGLLAASALAAGAPRSLWGAAALFYRSGALVFGGGHVVLPLLRDALVPAGWVSDGRFLAGYGAVQAAPGPLFTFAAYLGAAIAPPGAGLTARALWSLTALAFMFLPGLLLALAAGPLWRGISRTSAARGALAGVNAAVVGVLGAALYDPIWKGAVHNGWDLAVAAAGFLLLERWRVPPLLVVVFCLCAATVPQML